MQALHTNTYLICPKTLACTRAWRASTFVVGSERNLAGVEWYNSAHPACGGGADRHV